MKIRNIGLISWIFKHTHRDRCRRRYRCVHTHKSSSNGHSERPDFGVYIPGSTQETEALETWLIQHWGRESTK